MYMYCTCIHEAAHFSFDKRVVSGVVALCCVALLCFVVSQLRGLILGNDLDGIKLKCNVNEGTKVQNPRRLCHVYRPIATAICISGQNRECTGKYTEIWQDKS